MRKIIHIPHTSKFIPSDHLSDYFDSYEDARLDCINKMFLLIL